MNYESMSLRNDINRLEDRRRDILNYKFMGGGFGLFIFLFISMGIGIIVWIITSVSHNNELNRINVEISSLNMRIRQIESASTNNAMDEIQALKNKIKALEGK